MMIRKLLEMLTVSAVAASATIGCSGEGIEGGGGSEGPDDPEISTAQEALRGTRPLLVVMIRDPATDSLAHDKAWYRSRLFGTGATRSVSNYLNAVSRGKVTYTEAGILSFVDRSSDDAAAGVIKCQNGVVPPKCDDNVTRAQKRARYFAGKNGFNYAAYDTNGDGQIVSSELTILMIDNYSEAAGANPPVVCTTVSGMKLCNDVPVTGHRSSMMQLAHELSHPLGTGDLYGARVGGPGANLCLSQDLTLMSCTAKTNFDADFGFFLDPYHRERLNWLGPSQSGSTTFDGNRFIVSAVSNPWGENEALKVSNNFNESLTFELRGLYTTYDDRTPVGLYAWYTKTDANGKLVALPPLNTPNPKTDTDPSHFTLAPTSNCALNANDVNSRGVVAPLQAGEYVWAHSGGLTSFYIEPVLYGDNTYLYEISWNSGFNTERQCGQNDTGATVKVWRNPDFKATSQTFDEGNWDVGALNVVGNDTISSLKVSAGAVATLCSEHHGGGDCVSFTGSVNYIGDLLNERVSWIQVNKLF
jgi:M6 family metalloprotease-like protein